MAERDEQESFCLMVSESFIRPALLTLTVDEGLSFSPSAVSFLLMLGYIHADKVAEGTVNEI
jgi:hypothetical protein